MNDAWLVQWGYLAVATGAFVEGEATLLAAGAVAQRHSLFLPGIVVCGALGSFAWSQLWFRTGRKLGATLLQQHPEWRTRAARAQHAIKRYACAYLVSCRFIVGMGTAAPALFGAAGFSPRRFMIVDALGAALWSTAFSCTGWGVSKGLIVLGHAGLGSGSP
jgi:membrane protein DedA with SNARE-associated domain